MHEEGIIAEFYSIQLSPLFSPLHSPVHLQMYCDLHMLGGGGLNKMSEKYVRIET